MILNLGSLAFNANIEAGGGTPAWGTELGQGEGYKFSFEDMSDFFTGMVYSSIPDLENVTCPLGKGGNARDDYDFVIASLFKKIYVNGQKVQNAQFILLVIKKLVGDNHVGRRTIKYNPRMTYKGVEINDDCYKKMAVTLCGNENAAWFVHEILIRNQDELHFVAYELGQEQIAYATTEERKKAFLSKLPQNGNHKININDFFKFNLEKYPVPYRHLLTALRTKPFLLLAGISGTGKSRIVRELAKSCWKADEENTDFGNNCPRNFCMVQVKPNWHDSSELMGYVSRIGEKPVFVTGEFLKFITKAWKEPDKPYFLCLDEMNLAPVEQYFAEYLSVIESRKRNNDGSITTDPILKKEAEEWYHTLISNLTEEETLRKKFLEEGIALPQNLFVIGTVNMDETTFSFSRKVLDRAMTIEMNEVDLNGGLDENAPSEFGYIGDRLKCDAVEGKDVYANNKDLCDKVITYLEGVNAVLEGTPFKIAYRTRNEFIIYAVHRGEDNLANALDEMTSMKILSRIEGDADKIGNLLDRLESVIRPQVQEENPDDEHPAVMSVSLKKLDEMRKKLSSGYTSFWS